MSSPCYKYGLFIILVMEFLKLHAAIWLEINSQEQIEAAYEEAVLKKTLNFNNSICNYDKSMKITLCEILFERPEFQNFSKTGISLNKSAFTILEARCWPKDLLFLKKKYLNSMNIQEMMFNCYGRHNPMLTSYHEDDFLEKIMVSGDISEKFLFVYKTEKSLKITRTVIFKAYFRVEFDQIPASPLTSYEISSEWEMLNTTFYSRKPSYLERIYLQTNANLLENTFCKFSYINKLLLCQQLFQRRYYYYHFNFILNTNAFQKFNPGCEVNTIAFSSSLENNQIKQVMLPCFGRSSIINIDEEIFISKSRMRNKFFKQFTISPGPKPNSVFIYSQLGNDYSNVYSIHEFIQNFHFIQWNPNSLMPGEIFHEQTLAQKIARDISINYSLIFRNLYILPVENDDDDDVFLY